MSERLSTRDLALAAMFAALTAVGALFAIPFFGPIPFTLQVFFVLLAGLVLGTQARRDEHAGLRLRRAVRTRLCRWRLRPRHA